MRNVGSATPVLQLDEARYHRVETDDVPPGWASVPVELDDDGNIIPCTMVAGSVGVKLRSSGTDLHEKPGEVGLDTVSIESGWWMYERKSDEQMKEEKEAAAKAEKERYRNFFIIRQPCYSQLQHVSAYLIARPRY